jgi:glycosyltransferase involved in cell wall biosynthesis
VTAPLRILYVGTLPPHHGGSAIMASQVLVGLAAIGHEIEAIAPITEPALRSGDRFAARNQALTVSRFTMPYLDTSPDSPPPDGYQQRERDQIEQLVAESAARRRPDVIVIGRESFAPHAVGLARSYSTASVLLFQGATTMGILNGSYAPDAARRLLAHASEATVAVTPARHVAQSLAELGIRDAQVIPNPVDLERFRPRSPSPCARDVLGIGGSGIVAAHLSNLKGMKRAIDFVDAATLVAGEHDRIRFMVVGDGPCRAELEQACAERGVSDRFSFPGWIEHERIAEVFNCSDLVVMPSSGEAQALVYLEALACERTLIASDIPGAREVVEDSQNGLLHSPGDVARLAELILVAARDAQLRLRLGREGRRRVQRHALPHVVSRYDELLREVAGR